MTFESQALLLFCCLFARGRENLKLTFSSIGTVLGLLKYLKCAIFSIKLVIFEEWCQHKNYIHACTILFEANEVVSSFLILYNEIFKAHRAQCKT